MALRPWTTQLRQCSRSIAGAALLDGAPVWRRRFHRAADRGYRPGPQRGLGHSPENPARRQRPARPWRHGRRATRVVGSRQSGALCSAKAISYLNDTGERICPSSRDFSLRHGRFRRYTQQESVRSWTNPYLVGERIISGAACHQQHCVAFSFSPRPTSASRFVSLTLPSVPLSVRFTLPGPSRSPRGRRPEPSSSNAASRRRNNC